MSSHSNRVLPDTSAWIEYARGTGSAVHERLAGLITDDAPLAFTDPVRAELLVGARNDDEVLVISRMLLSFELLPFDRAVDFDGAVWIHHRCRARGVTPGGLLDCMIASVASRHGAAVLAHDAGFARMAEVIDLELDDASLR